MTGEPPDDGQTANPPHFDWSPIKLTSDEFETHGGVYGQPAPGQIPIEMMLAFAAGNFCSAFIQALGQRAGNSVANLPKQVSDLVRKRVKSKGQPEEIHISAKGDATATIVVTADTPDEARLALLDLDVTAEELRGKLLRWDPAASAWHPAGSASARRRWPWRRS